MVSSSIALRTNACNIVIGVALDQQWLQYVPYTGRCRRLNSGILLTIVSFAVFATGEFPTDPGETPVRNIHRPLTDHVHRHFEFIGQFDTCFEYTLGDQILVIDVPSRVVTIFMLTI